MAETAIQWCDFTMNPWRGCSKVHTGCLNCYAEVNYSVKMHGVKWGPSGTRVRLADAGWKAPAKWNKKAEKEGVRKRVFCASLADVFEDWNGSVLDHHGKTLYPLDGGYTSLNPGQFFLADRWPASLDDLRRDLFRLIDATPYLDWLLVTKRPENVRKMWPDVVKPGVLTFAPVTYRDNVWILTSVSDQETYDRAIQPLMQCRDLCPVLGLSAEPMIGPIDFGRLVHKKPGYSDPSFQSSVFERTWLDWVIFGGESDQPGQGPARECCVDWIRSGLKQCKEANVAAFVKQLGSNATEMGRSPIRVYLDDKKGGDWNEWPLDLQVREWPR